MKQGAFPWRAVCDTKRWSVGKIVCVTCHCFTPNAVSFHLLSFVLRKQPSISRPLVEIEISQIFREFLRQSHLFVIENDPLVVLENVAHVMAARSRGSHVADKGTQSISCNEKKKRKNLIFVWSLYDFTISFLILIPSPQARFIPSPASPTPSHGPITFLITQNGAENYQNLETSTIQGENWFWNGSQLIDWLGTLQDVTRLITWLIDWLTAV